MIFFFVELFRKCGFFVLKALGFLALWTMVGQFSWNQRTLEQQYHSAVNSYGMQNFFESVFFRPATWTKERAQNLVGEERIESIKTELDRFSTILRPSNLDPRKLEEIKRNADERKRVLESMTTEEQ